MQILFTFALNTALILTIYFQVVLLITFFENRKLKPATPAARGKMLPRVAILVPCWNEGKTVGKTIESLLALDYPRELLSIVVIDDGSTDNTFSEANRYANGNNISVYQKENGGKYTALNLGLSKVSSDLVGCLDADSFVERNALSEITRVFENPEVMAVIPLIKIYKPKTVAERLQNIEYIIGGFLRKMQGVMNALYVTPGPFSIYRRSVFERIGLYRHGHKTEDLEMALRMQSKRLRIENAERAIVYTTAAKTIRGLFRQRVRWIYGFLKNSIDYSFMIFRRAYGNLGVFSLPLAFISVFTSIFLAGYALYELLTRVYDFIVKMTATGFSIHLKTPEVFFINTDLAANLRYLVLAFLLTMLMAGFVVGGERLRKIFSLDTIYFAALYGLIAPLWLLKAVYSVIISGNVPWR